MELTPLEWLGFTVVGLLILRELRQLLGFRLPSRRRWYYRVEALVVLAVLVIGVLFYRDVEPVRQETEKVAQAIATKVTDVRQAIPTDWLEDLTEKPLHTDKIPTTADPGAYDLIGEVLKVTDGDTITVRSSKGKTMEIRFHGIDTPEYNQPHGSEASKALKRLLSGDSVQIDVKGTGRYGRTIGVVYVSDININEVMVCNGHAWWYKRYAASAANLRRCQETAKASGKGLWANENPIPPWEWRKRG